MALTKAQLVDMNANELILDLDADTSLHASTDDQIDIKIGGADDFTFTANTFTALAGSSIVVPASGLTIGSTAVTSTAAELNLIDGDASTGTTAVADADGIITNDGGTMRLTTAATFKTYFQQGISTAYDDLTIGDAAVLITTSSGNITIDAAASDSDIILKGTDGGVDTTFLTIDGSAAGDATFNNQIIVGDGKLVLGSTAVTSTAAELNLLDDKDATNLALVGKTEGTNFTGSLLVGHATTGTLNNADRNTAVGLGSLDALTIGDDNVALGHNAGTKMTGSQYCAAVGSDALFNNVSGSHNSALGYQALYNNTGHYNLGIGRFAGRNITSGDGNVMIGEVDAGSATGDRQLKIAGYDGSTRTTWISGDSSGNLTFAGDVTVGDDLNLTTDASVINFGADSDVVLTHVADTGLLLNTTMVVQFRDSAINIGSPADGDLNINADDEIELNSTLIDINGNVEISGTAVTTGVHTFTAVPVFPDNTIETADIQADAITGAKIADNAISEEHLDVTAVTGHTAETSIADGDTILIHDASASALRKMTKANFVSGIGGTNTPAFSAYLASNQSISNDSFVKVNFDTEIFDTNNAFASNRFTPAVVGKYLINAGVRFASGVAANLEIARLALYKNGSHFYEAQFHNQNNPPRRQYLVLNVSVDVTSTSDYFEIYGYLQASHTASGLIISGKGSGGDSYAYYNASKIIT